MQMNVLRTKQVSHVGNRDDHGQPIAGGDDQRCPASLAEAEEILPKPQSLIREPSDRH